MFDIDNLYCLPYVSPLKVEKLDNPDNYFKYLFHLGLFELSIIYFSKRTTKEKIYDKLLKEQNDEDMEFIKQSVNCNADDEEHNITFEHDYTDEFGFYSFT